MSKISSEELCSSFHLKNYGENNLYCVKWIPPVAKFFEFANRYREILNLPLGGTRVSRYSYSDPTIAKVLSVDISNNRSSLPQRISLSNFKIGTPITSYGVIYRYKGDVEPEYLLIRRNNSISYTYIIQGNYQESQLFFMLQDLPNDERERLLAYDYETLWKDLHLKPAEGELFQYGREVFENIRPHLAELFECLPSVDPDGKFLWLFPKGKPDWDECQVPESPYECALREFKEETNGLDLSEASPIFADPILERYLGSNSKNYQTDYFVFQTKSKPKITPFATVTTPIRELSLGEASKIEWVPLSKLTCYLRDARMDLVNYIESNISDDVVEIAPDWYLPSEVSDYLMDLGY